MNRRNFFKKLSGAIVGCYLGCQVKLPESSEWIPNPAWEKAEYEFIVFGFDNLDIGQPPKSIRKMSKMLSSITFK